MNSAKSSPKVYPLQEVRSKPVRKHSSNAPRFCQHDNCNAKLSVYNMTYFCAAHEKYHTNPKDFI